MSFLWPKVLWLLFLPVLVAAAEASRRRAALRSGRPKILTAEVGAGGFRLLGAAQKSGGRRGAAWWLAAGFILALTALARPQWGRLDPPAAPQPREILVVLDLSRSMTAEDVSPSRLEQARLVVRSLLGRVRGDRVGLEVFAGTAFLQSPFTSDFEILNELLPQIGPETMPVGGTDYGAMIDVAARTFSDMSGSEAPGSRTDRTLVILSDGGATDDTWRDHLAKLGSLGIRVVALGVGTEAGGLVPDGAGGFEKDESGAVVMSRIERGTLRELARTTGGVYRDASAGLDVASLISRPVGTAGPARNSDAVAARLVDRFQWVLAPAVLCLFVSFWLEFPVRPRPRDLAPLTRPKAAPVVAALLALLASSAALTNGFGAGPAQTPPLARMVARLSAQSGCSGRDWAELARETISWGHRYQANDQEVPDGPVADGLAAVDAGAASDPRLTDWKQLRAELEELRNKPRQNTPPPPSPSPKQDQRDSRQRQSQSAFGEMHPQPASSSPLQIGMPAPKRQAVPPPDSSLAVPLQKLDQIKDGDSPLELLKMIEDKEPKPPQKPGKDW